MSDDKIRHETSGECGGSLVVNVVGEEAGATMVTNDK